MCLGGEVQMCQEGVGSDMSLGRVYIYQGGGLYISRGRFINIKGRVYISRGGLIYKSRGRFKYIKGAGCRL